MLTHLTIPSNLNLEELIKTTLPQYNGNKSGITEQNLAYICHCIIQQWFTYKDDYIKQKYKKGGYVPLCAEYLDNIVAQSKNCLDFLIEQGVLLSDNHYKPGKKCRWYTLHKNYTGQGFKRIPVEGRVKGNLYKYFEQKQNEELTTVSPLYKKRKALINTLKSPQLAINVKAAKRAIYHRYLADSNKARLHDNYEALRQAEINKDVSYGLVDAINCTKDEHIIIDASGYRLHTPITRLPKYLRSFLNYSGQPLISLDVKNSQPYFSIRLLQKEFYNKNKSSNRKGVFLGGIDREVIEIINNKAPIMFQKIAKTLMDTGFGSFENFTQDVLSGQLYEKFMGDIPKGTLQYEVRRSAVKKELLTTMYDRPRLNSNRFKKEYPAVFKVFDIIKSIETGRIKRRKRYRKQKPKTVQAQHTIGTQKRLFSTPYTPESDFEEVDDGYTKLAIILQRIESYLLLDVVCRELYSQHPQIPLITIHDCIATTPEYVECLNEAINSTLTRFMGHPPKLQPEKWTNEQFIA